MNHPSLWLEKEFSTLYDLVSDGNIEHFNSGSVIYSQHDSLDRFYLVDKGVVRISILSYDGNEKIIGFQSQQSLFGMDCFCTPGNAVVTATALTDVDVFRVPHIMLEMYIQDHPEIGINLAKYYSKLLKLMCVQTEYQSFYDTLTRVVNYFFLYMKESEYEHPVSIKLTTEELATLAATSRVNISRILKQLNDMDIIEKKRGEVIIKDRKKLLDLCRIPDYEEKI